MHEMSVVAYIIETLDEFAEQNKIDEIKTVVLEVGALSEIIPEYVYACWEPAIYFSKHLKASTVEIEEIPGRGRCKNCGTEYDLKEHEGVCPACSLSTWEELSGGDMIIKEIRVENPDFFGSKQP